MFHLLREFSHQQKTLEYPLLLPLVFIIPLNFVVFVSPLLLLALLSVITVNRASPCYMLFSFHVLKYPVVFLSVFFYIVFTLFSHTFTTSVCPTMLLRGGWEGEIEGLSITVHCRLMMLYSEASNISLRMSFMRSLCEETCKVGQLVVSFHLFFFFKVHFILLKTNVARLARAFPLDREMKEEKLRGLAN